MTANLAHLRELKATDFLSVMQFSDREIGLNYFTETKLRKIFAACQQNGITCSFVLIDSAGLQGIRLSYAPGQWVERDLSQPLYPHLWQVPLSKTAYFQSLYVSSHLQKQGWGRKLSLASIENLRKMGAEAVVCHCWNESPNNSSRKYLDSLGFEPVISIADYWKNINYLCTGCQQMPCTCSATEMIKYL